MISGFKKAISPVAIFGAFLLLAVMLSTSFQLPQVAQAAAGEVLILEPTHTKPAVGGQPNSLVEDAVIAAGKTPVVVSAATWATMTAAQFDAYDAIAFGDPTCSGAGPLAAAEANKAVWSSVIDGNILLTGTDETFHSAYGYAPAQGGETLAKSAMAFVVAQAGKTGLYVSLSCYYHATAAGTPVSVLSEFGAFTVTGVGCYNDSHIVVAHAALAGLTDASLSSWSCSVHEAFDGYPADFLPLAIAEDTGGPPLPGSKSFPDGTSGVPYIMVRGEGIEICGDKIDNDGDGEIDEGCPPPPVEICGNGLDDDLDGEIDEGCNTAPDCLGATADPSLLWPPNHKFVPITITVTDSDGDPVTVTVTSIYQDEEVKSKSSGNTSPDGKGVGTSTAEVRAERNGDPKTPGDGRVYYIGFDATDGTDVCSGVVRVGVPHDQGQHNVPIGGGPLFDSTVP